MKEITVTISDAMYEALRAGAIDRGTTATRLATNAVENVAREWTRPRAVLVAAEHARRKSVAEIAATLDLTNQQVSRTLALLGLRAHLKPRGGDAKPKPFNPRARKARP